MRLIEDSKEAMKLLLGNNPFDTVKITRGDYMYLEELLGTICMNDNTSLIEFKLCDRELKLYKLESDYWLLYIDKDTRLLLDSIGEMVEVKEKLQLI